MMIEDEDVVDVLKCFAFIIIIVWVFHTRYSQGYNQHTTILKWVKKKRVFKRKKYFYMTFLIDYVFV